MNILNLEGTYFVKELKKRGHNVFSIGPFNECDLKADTLISPKKLIKILKNRNFFPDMVLWNDICRLPSVLGFEMLPCVTVGYSIDQYCNPWHIPFFSIFDAVFVAQKDYVFLFKKEYREQKIRWLPLFFNPEIAFCNDNEKREIDISFVGTIEGTINENRKVFLKNFSEYIPVVIKHGNYQKVYSKSKIVLNQSAAGELNFRIFEAMACGAAVLTEDTGNGLKELFIPEKEILIYKRGNYLDAVKVAQKWLFSEKLSKLAKAGYEKVKKYHSIDIRVNKILKLTEKLLYEKFYKWRINNKNIIFSDIAKSFFFLATDEKIKIPSHFRKIFLEIGNKYKI